MSWLHIHLTVRREEYQAHGKSVRRTVPWLGEREANILLKVVDHDLRATGVLMNRDGQK